MRHLNDFIVVGTIFIIIFITVVIIVIVIIVIVIIVIVIIPDALSEIYLKHYPNNGLQFLNAEYAHSHADQFPLPLGFATSFVLQFLVHDQDSSQLVSSEKPGDSSLCRTRLDTRNPNGGNASLEQSGSSPSRPKPPVPERPALVNKKSLGSVDAILETSCRQTSDIISPLKPVSLSLLEDTMASLPSDAQEFFFSDSDIDILNLSANELNSKTGVNSSSDLLANSSCRENSGSSRNHVESMGIKRSSGSYDNLTRTNLEMTTNREINSEQNKTDNKEQTSNSEQNWVSFS